MSEDRIGFSDLSDMICTFIQDEPLFNKETLIPKIKAIISKFNTDLRTKYYNEHETPGKALRRVRAIEMKCAECEFWREKLKKFCDITQYYEELEERLIEKGFRKKENE